jgi:hypothetical protein
VGGEGCHKPGFAASSYPAMRPRHHGEVPMRAQLRRTHLARSYVSRHERLSARPAPTPSRTLLRSAGRGKRSHVFLQFRMDARVEVAGGASDSRYWPLHQAAAPQRGSTSPRRCSLGVSFPVRDHIRSVSFGLFVTPHRLHLLALFLHS